MRKMFYLLFLATSVLVLSSVRVACDDSSYKAAAVQLVPDYTIWRGGSVNETVSKSIRNLATAVNLAITDHDADVVVLPEGGTGYFEADIHNGTVASLTPYCEVAVPIGSKPNSSSPQQFTISSAAANNSGAIVVLNFCEKVVVTDGASQVTTALHYDTSIVFSPEGIVLAKYRKWNLFSGDFLFNRTKVAEPTFFDTKWGRFGFFICFDLTFRDPSVVLIEKYGVKNILFSTDWINGLDTTATQMQRAFAMRYGVNLIASNDATCPEHCGGGIYSGNKVLGVYFDPSVTFEPKIVSATVPTNIDHQFNPKPVPGSLHVSPDGFANISWVQKDCGHGPSSCALFHPKVGRGWLRSETRGGSTACTVAFEIEQVESGTSEEGSTRALPWTLEAFSFEGRIRNSPSVVNRTSCRLRRCGQVDPRFPNQPCPLLNNGNVVVNKASNVVFNQVRLLAAGHGFAANTSTVFPEFSAGDADVSSESGLVRNLTFTDENGGAYLLHIEMDQSSGKRPTLFGATLSGQMSNM